jgi:2-methylisocitrate lyase-like PEP mutase family enzyme
MVSREEALAHCRVIVEASDLPVSADLEKGFGDTPEDVADTIRGAAATGLAGCSIEDHTIGAMPRSLSSIWRLSEFKRLRKRSENFPMISF